MPTGTSLPMADDRAAMNRRPGDHPVSLAIIGLNYAPEEVGIGPFTAGLAQGMAERGFAVRAIVGQPYYPRWRKLPGQGGPLWRSAREAGVALVRCPHYVPATPGGLRRILHLASFALAALPPAVALAARPRPGRPGVVVCIAPALLSVPVAWLAARLCGARLWIHVQDFEVDAASALGLVRLGRLARLASALERRLLALADRISTISPQMCARLAEKGVAPARIVELRNWASAVPDAAADAAADADARSPASSAYRAEWGLGDRRVALYSGNIANKQGIDIVIAAARLLAARQDIIFVICGEGPNRAALERQARGLGNVQFRDLQPAARLGELLALADVHLLPQLAQAADLVLPSKLANMQASGRPVVATAAPGTGLFAEIAGSGLATPPGDAAALAAAIAHLVDQPDHAARLGAEGRRHARERWSRTAILDRFAAHLAGLAQA